MKPRVVTWILGMVLSLPLLVGCEDEEDEPAARNEKRYTLMQLDNSGVSGTVTFSKLNEATTKVTVELTGTSAGNSHPAHIHANNAATSGPIVLDFNPVEGATGKSETNVTMLNDGTAITYEQLITYNGHVNVHKSIAEIAVMIAQGNIGSNATAQTPTTGGSGNGTGGY